ncbi:hypothetical protein FE257_000226 [Aspergillus nanangensis]|uniref:Major facilitator superfamily (MFS) profile domain-containing protein n=1 Tax=Aspergillus nanangensis TaxID=2582783 RepID=A0AAD4D0Z7_ASPNN|nr:hypothetical protein FE257_000226 [Aspergillus nanangensis]
MGFLGTITTQFRHNGRALLFCSISAIGALVYGYDNTYYNGVLAMQEFKNDYGSHFENGQKALAVSFSSLTTSSIYIGDLLGALISAPINDKWGRKAVFWFASACVIAGGVAQVADTHYEGVIVLGRILIGLGVGQFTVTSLLYIGEVAPVEIRGPALMMYQFLQSCSQLVASGITQGTEGVQNSISYKLPMGGLIILPLLLLVVLPFVPESPFWFIMKGRPADAEKALRTINKGHADYDPSDDLHMLQEIKRIEDQQAETSSWKALVLDPIERRKLLASAGAMYAQQICGILFFYNYGVVFAQAIGISEPFLIQLITNILQIFAVAACVLTGNKVHRRSNLLITTAVMFFAFIVIGGIGTQKTLTTASQYVIVVFSYVVIIAYNFGQGPLTYTIAREMAVGVNQNKIMSAAIVLFYFVTWLVSFTAPYLYYSANLGPMLGFVYAATTLTSLAWVWFYVGETTGRTNLEISLFFQQQIPVRQWRTHVFDHEGGVMGEKAGRRSSSLAGDAEHVEKPAV